MSGKLSSGLLNLALLTCLGAAAGCEFITAIDRDDLEGDTQGAGGGQGGSGGSGGSGGGEPPPVGEALWGRSAGELGDERIEGIAVDPGGGLVLVGGFQSTINWGGDADELISAGGKDVMLVKLDDQHQHVWSRSFGDGLEQYATAVAVAENGDIILVGEFDGTLAFGEGPPLVSAGGKDLFVARLDAEGNHLWSRGYGDAVDQYATAVAVTDQGDIAVVGMFDGTINFGDDPGAALVSPGSMSAVVARLDAAGNHLWSIGLGGAESWQRFRSVAASGSHVYLGGSFEGLLDVNGDTFASTIDGWTGGGGGGQGGGGQGGGGQGGGGQGGAGGGGDPGEPIPIYGADGIVFKLELDNGKVAWARPVGAVGEQYIKFVSVDPGGNPVVLGNYNAAFEVGTTPIPHTDEGGYNLYLARFDADTGEPLAARGFPTEGDQFVWGLNQDPWGAHLFGGYFTKAAQFGDTPIPITGGSEGDAFLCKLSEDFSAELWTDVYRDTQYSFTSAQAVTSEGNTIAAGLFYGASLEIGGGLPPLQHSDQPVPGNNGDIFLLDISP